MRNKWRLLRVPWQDRGTNTISRSWNALAAVGGVGAVSDGARSVRAVGVASDGEREPVFVNPLLIIVPSTSTLSSTSVVLRSVRSASSQSTMFYTRVHLRRFGFRLPLRKGVQNTHMVAER